MALKPGQLSRHPSLCHKARVVVEGRVEACRQDACFAGKAGYGHVKHGADARSITMPLWLPHQPLKSLRLPDLACLYVFMAFLAAGIGDERQQRHNRAFSSKLLYWTPTSVHVFVAVKLMQCLLFCATRIAE